MNCFNELKKFLQSIKILIPFLHAIKEQLSTEKFKKRFTQDASRMIHSVKYKPEVLSEFVQKYHGKMIDIPLTERKPGIEYTQPYSEWNKTVIRSYFDKDEGIILYCQEIEKSVTPILETVKSRLLPLYFNEQAKEMVQSQLNQALKEAQMRSFDKVAEKYGATVQKASFKYNQGKNEQSSILEGA